MEEIPYDISWAFDERGRDRPNDPAAMRAAIEWLRQRAEATRDAEARARMLGLAGGYARMTGELELSQSLLREALGSAEALGQPRLEAAITARLAHTLHWQEAFEDSDALFEGLVRRCREDERLAGLLDFALQHHGKSLLDQGRIPEATACLEEALALRRDKGDEELIASTGLALSLARAAGAPSGASHPADPGP